MKLAVFLSVFLWASTVFAVPIEINSNVVFSYNEIVTMEKYVQKELGMEYKWRKYNVKGFPSYGRPSLEKKGKYSFGTIFFDGKDEGVLVHELAHVYGASEWEAYQIAWKWLYNKGGE